MLAINNFPPCGFGNRVLYYYNLRQKAHDNNIDFYCVPWEGYQYFKGDMLGKRPTDDNYKILDFCLGEEFYSYNGISTRDVFQLKNTFNVNPDTCAVHFRGTDFHAWNPDSILKYQYYCDSIEEIKDKVTNFVLFTDDNNLPSYKKVVSYLNFNNIKYFVGENTHDRRSYINDFTYMTECDWVISSPSTFCISAGAIGKRKNIIHSKEWIENRLAKKDKFWVDLYNGGNDNYKLWRII